jgi:hypothetical protein
VKPFYLSSETVLPIEPFYLSKHNLYRYTGVDSAGRPIHGALNLVDLAGSERLSRTGATVGLCALNQVDP